MPKPKQMVATVEAYVAALNRADVDAIVALYAEDGVVQQLHVEAPGEYRVSSAEHMLSQLP